MNILFLITCVKAFNWLKLSDAETTICDSQTLTTSQRRLCLHSSIGDILPQAVKRTQSNCRETMTDQRWNCDHSRKSSREFAYVEALSTAHMMNTAERQCLEGNCRPLGPIREMVGLTQISRLNKAIRLHNLQVGVKSVTKRKKSTCHGQSGACTTWTCWDQSADEQEVAVTLKHKYEGAVQIGKSPNASVPAELALLTPNFKDTLLFSRNDDDFCHLTQGRTCQLDKMNGSHCSRMCCGRGHLTRETKIERPDQCTFNWPDRIDCHATKTVTQVDLVCM